MKNLLTIGACGLLIVFLTLSCNNGLDTPVSPDEVVVKKSLDNAGLRVFDESKLSGENAVEVMADLIIFTRDNLSSRNGMRKFTEIEFSRIKKAKTEDELKRVVGQLGGNPDRILQAVKEFQKIARFLKNENMNINVFAMQVVKKASEKSLKKRLANLKAPDCAGLCSQQFNMDIQSCENELAMGIGGSLVAGALSGGMAGAGGFIITVGLYFNCEDNAFGTLENCASGCGM